MAKVGCEIGLTIALSKTTNEFLKVHGSVSEIDTELPFEEQAASIEETFSKTLDFVQIILDNKLDEMAHRGVFNIGE